MKKIVMVLTVAAMLLVSGYAFAFMDGTGSNNDTGFTAGLIEDNIFAQGLYSSGETVGRLTVKPSDRWEFALMGDKLNRDNVVASIKISLEPKVAVFLNGIQKGRTASPGVVVSNEWSGVTLSGAMWYQDKVRYGANASLPIGSDFSITAGYNTLNNFSAGAEFGYKSFELRTTWFNQSDEWLISAGVNL